MSIPAQIKLSVVKEVLDGKESVTWVAKKFNVSRRSLYRWLKLYERAPLRSKKTCLAPKYVSGEKHPRAIYPRIEGKVLGLVVKNPNLSVHKLKDYVDVSSWTVWKILDRHNLNLYQQRLAYVQALKAQAPAPSLLSQFFYRVRLVWEQFIPSLALAPPPETRQRILSALKTFSASVFLSFLLGFGTLSWIRILGGATSTGNAVGLILATVALGMGSVFFLYSLKYYLTLAIVLSFSQTEAGPHFAKASRGNGFLSWILGLANGQPTSHKATRVAVGLEPNLEHITLKRYPFISVHIPLYNEKNVVERAIAASTNFQYQGGYEVILCDDSTDETTEIIKRYMGSFGRASTVSSAEPLRTSLGEGYSLTECEVRPGVVLKHLHRTSRSGFKGGALREALRVSDSRAEFVSVFDADFVPYPDTLELFLKYFQATAGTLDFRRKSRMVNDQWLMVKEKKNNINHQPSTINHQIAAVQGYQWHVLNKSENWITRGIRSEYAGSYVIERSGIEIYSGLKQISGAVYMIRRDVLEEVGWGVSITEDFELTLRLYAQGYRVVYTPYIQAPAECVSTLKRLIRQRMRWAEGHSNNVRRMFTRLLFGYWDDSNIGNDQFPISNLQSNSNDSMTQTKEFENLNIENSLKTENSKIENYRKKWIPSPLSLSEKLEFLYLSPYYLQAFFFLIGTLSWLISETVFPSRLPFWTSLWGWSLVLTNLFSLPLMNSVGLFLEESEERDYQGLASFIALSYILVPFQAYAALKGFLQEKEGPWFRTPKTGKITDIFTRGRFYRLIAGILPGRTQPTVAQGLATRVQGIGKFSLNPIGHTLNPNPYLSLATANNRFNSFKVKQKKVRWMGKAVLTVLLVISVSLISFTPFVPSIPSQHIQKEAQAFVDRDSTIPQTSYTTPLVGDLASAQVRPRYGSADERGYRERLDLRQPTSKTFQAADGTHAWAGTIGPMHYQNDPNNPNEEWEDIDTRVVGLRMGEYEYGNETNTFRSYFKPDPTSQDSVRYQYGESFITFTLLDNELGVRNSGEGFARDNQFVYASAYENIDVRYSITPTQLLEEFVLRQPMEISAVTQRIHFENARMQQEDGAIVFYALDSNEQILEIPRPVMYEDANPAAGSFGLHYELTPTDDPNTYLLIKVIDEEGKAWLSQATYPVVIDATINTSVAAGSDDAHHCPGFSNSATNLCWGNLGTGIYTMWLRFTNITIPPGSVINSSSIGLTRANPGGSSNPSVTISGIDNANTPTFSTDPSSRPLTTANVAWAPADAASWTTPALTTVVQEVVDLAGWASGNALGFKFATSTSNYLRQRYAAAYEHTTLSQPTLTIDYTAPPAAPSNCQATYVSDTQINVTWTDNSDNETGFKIERSADGAAYSQIGTDTASPYSDTTTSADHKYQYRVRAYNASGDSAYCTATSIIYTSPDPPTSVSASHTANLQITLSWTDQSLYEDQFRIERDKNGGGYVFLANDAASPYVDNSITQAEYDNRDTFTYRVRSEISSQGRVSAWVYSNAVIVPERVLLLAPIVLLLPALAGKFRRGKPALARRRRKND